MAMTLQEAPLVTTMEPESVGRVAGVDWSSSAGSYWWLTSGRDLSIMLQEANYLEAVQERFLEFYRDVICPQLGGRPSDASGESSIVWDGTPLEYSFELRDSTGDIKVRFTVDLSQLNPIDLSNPLGTAPARKVISLLPGIVPGFDDTWASSLIQFMDYSSLTASKQQDLVAAAGHQTSTVLGFDIHNTMLAPQEQHLPLGAKIYFSCCLAAAAKGATRWEVASAAFTAAPRS